LLLELWRQKFNNPRIATFWVTMSTHQYSSEITDVSEVFMNTSKALMRFFYAVLMSVLFCALNVHSAEAQATFGVAGSASIVNSLGYTELIGPVTFSVASGTTKSGTLEFFIPDVVFTDTSGLMLVGSGGLTGATIAAVIPSGGDVIINIPAGAGPGSYVTLSGLRISGVGAPFTSLKAAISTSGNSILAGQNSIQVVQNVTNGMIITNNGSSTLTVANNVIVNSPGTYVIAEGFIGSFSSAIGVAGQTNKTQVVFQVSGLPDGISLTFPSPISSDTITGATLATTGGGPQIITNQSTSNRVIYEYNATAVSGIRLDQFTITPTIDITGTVGSGNALIQVAMGPIGAAVPDTDHPSTAIPRYIESFTPSTTTPPAPVIVTNLAFPVPSGLDNDALTISNTDNGTAAITAIARAEDGSLATGISNQVTFNLSAGRTTSVTLKDLFGSGASSAAIAGVELTASNRLIGNSIATVGSNRLGIASPVAAATTYLPFDLVTSADIPVIAIENTSSSDVNAQIVLRSSLGAILGTTARTVKSHGVVRESFSTLFSSGSIPLSGYVSVVASGAVASVLVSNRASHPEEVPSLIPVSSTSTFPFFVFGGGYNTLMTLINASDTLSANIGLTAYTSAGSAMTAQSIVQMLAPGQRQDFDFAGLLGGAAGQVNAGYFILSAQSTTSTPFGSPTVPVYGMVRISTTAFSTAVPLFNDSGAQFYMTPTTETTTAYTGLALVNTSSADVSVTLEVTSATGASLGTTSFTLARNNGIMKLLREFIPQSLPHDNGRLRISGTGNVKVLGFLGTLDSSQLIFLRGETTP
jgi:hypothetical protein